jgi:hypothetical protein
MFSSLVIRGLGALKINGETVLVSVLPNAAKWFDCAFGGAKYCPVATALLLVFRGVLTTLGMTVDLRVETKGDMEGHAIEARR